MFASFSDAIFWIAVALCAVAQAAIVRSVLRMRAAPLDLDGSSLPATRPAVEIAWVVIPALVLTIVLAITWRSMHPVRASSTHAHVAVARTGH